MWCANRKYAAAMLVWVALGVGGIARGGVAAMDKPARSTHDIAETRVLFPADATRGGTLALQLGEPLALNSEVRFPDLANSVAASDVRVEAPVRQVALTAPLAEPEQTLVPLPPAAWSGLAMLAGMGLFGCRKAVLRFVM
jgi:hypothetical protein